MKLYYHPFSQHARRVRVLCQELGLKPELMLVALEKGEHLARKFVGLNPAHAVPVLDDDGFVLAESNAIMRYLCDRHHGDRFYPRDGAARALVDQWLDWNHCKLNPPLQTLTVQLMFMGDKADAGIVDKARREADEALKVLDAGLLAGRGMGGKEASLADVAIATTVALHEPCGVSLEAVPRVRSWYEGIKRWPSFAATSPMPTAA